MRHFIIGYFNIKIAKQIWTSYIVCERAIESMALFDYIKVRIFKDFNNNLFKNNELKEDE